MECPYCNTANEKKARFCRTCGNQIQVRCPACDRRARVDARFCPHCGHQFGEAPAVRPAPASLPATVVQTPGAEPTPKPAYGEAPRPPKPAAKPVPASEAESQTNLQRFIPKELISKLDAARASGQMVGERRVVTVLFCDVKGSTAAAERLDPEEWTEIMNGAFEHMIRPVYHYEGTLANLMGDAILAFFGAPIAHEDDPQRAVLAGLDIAAGIAPYREQVRQKWGVEFNVRIGINTGLVVVGAVGSDLRMQYSALGDAINVAARMEQTAVPGTVQVAHDTYRLVRGQFDFEDLGGIEVKGKHEPVQAYRPLRRKAVAAGGRGIEGLHAELVGREAEMQALRGVITDLMQGVGRIVCVLGEAGMGKTRLIVEARHLFREAQGQPGHWHEVGSLSYESHQAYGLFQRLIRRVLGLSYEDSEAAMREKLTALVTTLPAASRARALPIFEALFALDAENGAKLDGETFQRELLETVREWWRSRFAEHPTVLVFDDMHWCDAASVELLRRLLPLTEEIPLVLLCALRAERQAPAWQIKTIADEEYRHRTSELNLRPLSDAESNELVSRLLHVADLPDRLRASILEKAGGNPFFIEEVVRALIDSGAVVCEERTVDGTTQRYWTATSEGAEFAIPDSLQSLLASRLDQLEEATRSTLQMASVIGRSFFRRVLEAVDDDSAELEKHIGTLVRLEMIREAARKPEIEYAFRNPLTQEAIYQTILLKRRREFHRRVGEATEALYQGRLESFLGLLAHHFTMAGEHDKAVKYSRQAARQASALFAYSDAIRNLRVALELIDAAREPQTRLGVLEELGDAHRDLRDAALAIAHYRQALDVWHALPDGEPLTAVRLHRKIVQIASEAKWSVDLEEYRQAAETARESLASLEETLQAPEAQDADAESVRALAVLSFDAWRNRMPPEWERARAFAQSAVEMAQRLEKPVILSRALSALANVMDGESRLRDHLQIAMQRLEISRDAGAEDALEQIDAISGTGLALTYVGEYAQALPHVDEAARLAASVRSVGQEVAALQVKAQCLFRLDRWDDVLAVEAQLREISSRHSRQQTGPT